MNHFLNISTKDFQLDFDPNCSLALSLMIPFVKKSFNPLCDKIYYRSEQWLHRQLAIQLVIDGTRKSLKISMYMRTLIVEVIIAIPPSFKWHATLCHDWRGKSTCFLQAVSSVEQHLTKAPASSPSHSWFITEYYFHPIVHTLWFFLFSLLKPHFRLFVLVLVFVWLFCIWIPFHLADFVQISHKYWSCLDLFVFHLLC